MESPLILTTAPSSNPYPNSLVYRIDGKTFTCPGEGFADPKSNFCAAAVPHVTSKIAAQLANFIFTVSLPHVAQPFSAWDRRSLFVVCQPALAGAAKPALAGASN